MKCQAEKDKYWWLNFYVESKKQKNKQQNRNWFIDTKKK